MRRIAMLGMAATTLVSGCALDAGDEEQAGETPHAFTKTWHTEHMYQSEEIKAPIGSILRVTSKADIADRATCGSKGYAVRLLRFDSSSTGTVHQVVEGIDRSYPLNQSHTESWVGVTGGSYRLLFDTTRPKLSCELRGTFTIDVTPPKK